MANNDIKRPPTDDDSSSKNFEQQQLTEWENTSGNESEGPIECGDDNATEGTREVEAPTGDCETGNSQHTTRTAQNAQNRNGGQRTDHAPVSTAESPEMEVSVGQSYPQDADFICDECHEFSTHSLSELRDHVQESESVTWSDYLRNHPLHRCASCEQPLTDLSRIYCMSCGEEDDIHTKASPVSIPCRYCGRTTVSVADPFCSPECAVNGLEYYHTPLSPPQKVDEEYLNHPFRTENGIPSSAPLIASNEFVCRECYQYGSDDIHGLSVHVGKAHSCSWETYIEKFRLQRCDTCRTPLRSLSPCYCGADCRKGAPASAKTSR